jgi:molybdenum cofactor sulfurtransferase
MGRDWALVAPIATSILICGGAVRISLGLVTNFADVSRLVRFAQAFLDTFPGESDLPPRLHC